MKLTAPCMKCKEDIDLRHDWYKIDKTTGSMKQYEHMDCDNPKGEPPEDERFAYG